MIPYSWEVFRQLQRPYPPALPDDDAVAAVCDQAVADLGTVRGLAWLGDAAAQLHLLASLAGHIHARLPEAVRYARDQELSWDDIGALLGIRGSTARSRYQRHTDATKGAPLDH